VKQHVGGIDVLRGVAVLAVILYHFDVPFAPGGYLGVDLFMVISGFLITSSLLDLESKQHRFRDFYLRRARRLLPGVCGLIVIVMVASSVLMPAVSLGGLRWDAVWSLGYSVNWRFIATNASYFDTVAPPSPFRHLWSLAIEEQFYLAWPIVLFAIPRRFRVSVVSVLIVASALLMYFLRDTVDPFRAYYGTDTRAQALLAGAFLALIAPHAKFLSAKRVFKRLMPVAGAVIVLGFLFANAKKPFMYSGPHLLVAVCGAVLVAAAVLMRERDIHPYVAWLAVIGRRSYSLYLWHWPIIVLVSDRYIELPEWAIQFTRVCLILVLSEVSFQLLEVRSQKYLRSPKRVAVTSFSAVAVAVAVLFSTTAGAKSLPTYLQESRRVDQVPSVAGRPFVRIIGDSVVESLRAGYEAAAKKLGIRLELIVISGCGIMPGPTLSDNGEVYAPSLDCPATVAGVLSEVDQTTRADVLVWQAAWDSVSRQSGDEKLQVSVDDDDLVNLFKKTAVEYQFLARDVVIVTTAVRAETSSLSPNPPEGAELSRFVGSIANIRRAAADDADKIHYVDVNELVCDGRLPCPDVSRGGVRFRPSDGIHYEGAENQAVAEWILESALLAAGVRDG